MRSSRGLTRWAEFSGRRRRRRQLVLPRAIVPRTPPPCLSGKGAGHQNAWSHTRMLGPSVYPAYLEREPVIRMLGPIPECLVLQYFQIHESYQNAWSFRISRFTSHTRMLGPSVFPASQVIPKCLVLQYFQIHGSCQNAGSSDTQSISSDSQSTAVQVQAPKV